MKCLEDQLYTAKAYLTKCTEVPTFKSWNSTNQQKYPQKSEVIVVYWRKGTDQKVQNNTIEI